MNLSGTARVTTIRGTTIDLLHLKPGDISILDIATGLAHTCRFGGQCKFFFSVAQHSMCGCEYINEANKLPFLLHDASEAYMSDVVSNLKRQLSDYKYIENLVQSAIFREFGVVTYDIVEVKRVDEAMKHTEAKALMQGYESWGMTEPSLPVAIRYEDPELVLANFLICFWRCKALYIRSH